MTVKCTGSEWNAFYHDSEFWPEDAWWDDGEITVSGVLIDEDYSVDDIIYLDVVRMSGGIVYLRKGDEDGPSLESHFKRWRKQQSMTTLLVEVSKEQADMLRALIRQVGGKVR